MTLGDGFTLLGYIVGAAVYYLALKSSGGLRRAGQIGARDGAATLPETAGQGPAATPGNAPTILLVAALVGGMLGGKLFQWLLLGWPWHGSAGAILDPNQGGRTIIAGIICGWASVEVAKWRLGIRQSTGDPFALALPAGEAVGRIGCFFNQCCYGIATGLPHGLPCSVYQHDAWRLPTQLYASLIALTIFGVLFALRRRMPRQGDLFRLFLVLYGAGRFALEFARYRDHLYWGLSLAQWVCIEVMLAGAVTLLLPRFLQRRAASAAGFP